MCVYFVCSSCVVPQVEGRTVKGRKHKSVRVHKCPTHMYTGYVSVSGSVCESCVCVCVYICVCVFGVFCVYFISGMRSRRGTPSVRIMYRIVRRRCGKGRGVLEMINMQVGSCVCVCTCGVGECVDPGMCGIGSLPQT